MGSHPAGRPVNHPFPAPGSARCPGGRGRGPGWGAQKEECGRGGGPSLREIPVQAVGQARLPPLPLPGPIRLGQSLTRVAVAVSRLGWIWWGRNVRPGSRPELVQFGGPSKGSVERGLRSPEEEVAAARAPTHDPADLRSGLPSPPSAPLEPEHLDSLHQVAVGEGVDGQALGNLLGARTLDSEPLLGATAAAQPWAGPTGEECPVCTEPYGPSEHCLTLLNCGHGLCSDCLLQLLGTAPSADLGRVRCPLCRQKTPMPEWEICQLQEELLQADGPQPPRPPTPPAPLPRGRGPWACLEHRYQLRFLAGPVGSRGCLPFLPCPPCLGAWLWALRERGPCTRRLALLGLLGLELMGLLLVFSPLMLLGLLFMLLDRSGR